MATKSIDSESLLEKRISLQLKKIVTRYKKRVQHEYSAANCMHGC